MGLVLSHPYTLPLSFAPIPACPQPGKEQSFHSLALQKTVCDNKTEEVRRGRDKKTPNCICLLLVSLSSFPGHALGCQLPNCSMSSDTG